LLAGSIAYCIWLGAGSEHGMAGNGIFYAVYHSGICAEPNPVKTGFVWKVSVI